MKRSKKALIEIRDASYRGPVIPEKRCETCAHGWFEYSNQCHVAMTNGGRVNGVRTVHKLGCCDLWESVRKQALEAIQ